MKRLLIYILLLLHYLSYGQSLARWTGSSVSVFPTTSWAAPNGAFPTQARNDNSDYTWTSSTSTLTLPSSNLADGYLIIGRIQVACTHNNRNTISTQIVQTSGTGNFIGTPTSSYSRNNNNNENYGTCFAFVDNPSASSTYQFQWKREVGDGTPAGSITRSSIDVKPLYYADVGIYASTSTSLYGGTTPNQVTLSSTVLEGINITRSANVVTVTGDNKYYLILQAQYYEGRGDSRTQRWIGFDYDGTQDDAAKSYFYSRDSGTDFSGSHVIDLIETATASRTIELNCYRGDGIANNQGGADVDGSAASVGDHSLVVIELNDSAEVLRSTNTSATNQNIDLGGTPADISGVNTVTFNDSASFTKVSATSINTEKAMDALVGANISGASRTVSSGTRYTGEAELTINGTEDINIFHGDYLRGNQSTTDTFGYAANPVGFVALSSGDDIGFSCTENGDSGDATIQAGWAGFWVVNLKTLEGGAPTPDKRYFLIN